MDEIYKELKEVFDINTKPYLTIDEVARLLGISRNTIDNWVNNGLKIISWGERSNRIRKTDLDDYLTRFEK